VGHLPHVTIEAIAPGPDPLLLLWYHCDRGGRGPGNVNVGSNGGDDVDLSGWLRGLLDDGDVRRLRGVDNVLDSHAGRLSLVDNPLRAVLLWPVLAGDLDGASRPVDEIAVA
jgi:hypothetical protein